MTFQDWLTSATEHAAEHNALKSQVAALLAEIDALKAERARLLDEDAAEDALYEARIAEAERRISALVAEDALEDNDYERRIAALEADLARERAGPAPTPAPEPLPTGPAPAPPLPAESKLVYEDIVLIGGRRCWFHGAPGKPNPKAPADQQIRLTPRPWNLRYVEDQHYRFETRAYYNEFLKRWEEDRAPFDNEGKVRSELCFIDKFQAHKLVTAEFDFMLEEGPLTERAWLIPFQLHQDDPSAARARGQGSSNLANSIGSSPFFSVNIVKSKDGKREILRVHGDTSMVSPLRGFPKWRILSNNKDNTLREIPFTRGVRHSLKLEIVDTNGIDTAPFPAVESVTPTDGHWGRQGNWGKGTGLCRLWYDGDLIVDHVGVPMGYGYASPESGGIGSYVKLGIYAGARTGLTDPSITHPDPTLVAHYYDPRFTWEG